MLNQEAAEAGFAIFSDFKDGELITYKFLIALQEFFNPEEISFLTVKMPANKTFQLLERANGKKQLIVEIQTARSTQQINLDSAQAPDVLPPFEAIQLADGQIVLLIDWIDGRMPNKEEKALCFDASFPLISITDVGFDSFFANYVITESGKIFYVDTEVPIAIAQHGLISS